MPDRVRSDDGPSTDPPFNLRSKPLELISSGRGRARWRAQALVGRHDLAKHVVTTIGSLDGLQRVKGSAVTGSILVHFAADIPHATVRAHVEQAVAAAERLRCDGALSRISNPRSESPRTASSLIRELAVRHAVPLRKYLLASLTYRLVETVVPALPNLAIDALRDEARSPLRRWGLRSQRSQLAAVAALGAGLWGIKARALHRARSASAELAHRAQRDLRNEVYAHIQTLDMEFLNEIELGDIATLLDADIEAIEGVIDDGVTPLVPVFANALSAATVFAATSPKLGLLQLLAIPTLLAPSVCFIGPARSRYAVSREAKTDLAGVLLNNVESLTTIQSFTAEARELRRVEQHGERYMEADLRAKAFTAQLEPALDGAAGLVHLLTTGGGAGLMLRGELSAGTLSTLAALSSRLSSSVAYAGLAVESLQRDIGALGRVAELLNVHPGVESGAGRLPLDDVRGEIKLRDVHFSYGGEQAALRGTSIEIRPGQMTAIVGTTGAGKSTLVKLLLRFHEFSAGAITLDGHDIRDLDVGDIRRAISFVAQDGVLFGGTVRENISYGRPSATATEIAAAAHAAAAEEFIEALPNGYDTEIGERAVKLSGGQRQRIAIARALLRASPILVLDEATSAVDNETEEAIRRSLHDFATSTTRIVIAHRLSTVRSADRIYVMHDGTVVEAGTHDELLGAEGLYAGLWRVQIGEA